MKNTKKMTEERLIWRASIALLSVIPFAYTLEALGLMNWARVCYGVMAVIAIVALIVETKFLKNKP